MIPTSSSKCATRLLKFCYHFQTLTLGQANQLHDLFWMFLQQHLPTSQSILMARGPPWLPISLKLSKSTLTERLCCFQSSSTWRMIATTSQLSSKIQSDLTSSTIWIHKRSRQFSSQSSTSGLKICQWSKLMQTRRACLNATYFKPSELGLD